MKISIAKPYFTKDEIKEVEKVLKSGWVVQGPKVKEFEEMFAKFVGVKYAIAVSSCTAALHLSLVALEINQEDEVIVPAFTFIATANVVESQRAKPVFVDIDPKTFNIDVSKIEKAITKKTKAIIPVHLFGLSANMSEIKKIAKKYNLYVIEDAACGMGSIYKGKHVGTFGNTGCFSFHPRKAITTGEGGMIVTNSKKIEQRLRSLSDHGASQSDLARHIKKLPLLPKYKEVGYNYRMTDIQAAIGVKQMEKADFILKNRQRIARTYDKSLRENNFLQIPFTDDEYVNSYQSYVISIKKNNKFSRDKFAMELINKGISVRQGTHSVPHLDYYSRRYNYDNLDFPESFSAEKQSLALPVYANMTKKEQKFVIKTIKEICAE